MNQRQEDKMVICYTEPVRHDGDHLNLVLLTPQHRLPRYMGLNLGKYNIWYGRGFVLPQTIHTVEQGNYNFILLTETKIPDTVY